MRKIQMVDLQAQFEEIQLELSGAFDQILSNTAFINGPDVQAFKTELSDYLGGVQVVPCANGTDALQIAMMALGLKAGDKVLAPSFTYVATAEVAALLGMELVFCDVDPHSFNICPESAAAILEKEDIKAIVPVHLFGQSANMDAVMALAKQYGCVVIEDMAQAIGSFYQGDSATGFAGAIGHAAGTSFFPSKNLGCYGDGGAVLTPDADLAARMQMIANHGQSALYYHDVVGVNSRLDTLQAAVLRIKLRRLLEYTRARQHAAGSYDAMLGGIEGLHIPVRDPKSTHVFHQYTLTLSRPGRTDLMKFLESQGIPVKIYYPVPLHLQKAYNHQGYTAGAFPVSEHLCDHVLSLPMHTHLQADQLEFIADRVRTWFASH